MPEKLSARVDRLEDLMRLLAEAQKSAFRRLGSDSRKPTSASTSWRFRWRQSGSRVPHGAAPWMSAWKNSCRPSGRCCARATESTEPKGRPLNLQADNVVE